MQWFTATEIADKLKVNPRTVRRYWEAHRNFIKYRKEGTGPLEISDASLPVLKKIRTMYDQKYSKNRIDEELEKSFPIFITQEDESVLIAVQRDSQGTAMMDNSFYDDMLRRFEDLEEKNNRLLVLLEKKDTEFQQERQMYLERERRRDEDMRKLTEGVLQMVDKINTPTEQPIVEAEEVPVASQVVEEEPESTPVQIPDTLSRSRRHQKKSFWGTIFSLLSSRK